MTSLPIAPGDRSVPWRDVFPPTWHVKPVKYACSINRDALPETTDPDAEFRYVDISSVDSEGNWSASEPMRFGDAPSRARRIVADGDVLVSTVRTYLRAIAHVDKVDEPLICSTGFAVLSANGAADSKFLAYWVRSVYFVDEVVARSTGVSYPAVNASDVGNIPCPLLPLDEQRAIARFLDRETARLDALIEKKRHQIALLHQKRTALISRAVTKGTDPNAPMKESGIEWLGSVPEHWDIIRLRFLGNCQNGIAIGGEHFGSGYPFVSYGDVYKNMVLPSSVEGLVQSTEHDRSRYSVVAGDVLFTRTSETVEEIGLSSVCLSTIPDATFAGFLIRFRPHSGRLRPNFAIYSFRNHLLRAYFVKEMNLVTRASLSQDLLKDMPVLLPPEAEQNRIASYLDRETERIETLVGKISLSIGQLLEYRTALISAAVTGKIDVRQDVG